MQNSSVVQAQSPVKPGSIPAGVDFQEIDSISRMVLDTVSEGIVCIDQNGCTTFVNPAAVRMLGWTAEELMGKPQHPIIHHSHADGTPYSLADCPIYSVLLTRRAKNCEDEVFWRKDGTSFAVSYTSTPIDEKGVLNGISVIFRDISERVRRDRWQRSKEEIFHAITTQKPLDETLQNLANAYTAFQPDCSIAILLRTEEEGGSLSLIASSAVSAALKAELQLVPIGEYASVCGRAAFLKEELIADGPSAGAALIETIGPPAQRCLALPMTSAGGQLLGVLAFMLAPERANQRLTPSAFALPVALHLPHAVAEHGGLRGIRDLAQIAVEHRKLQSELVHQSEHDRLTGLPNWRLVEQKMKNLLRAADLTKTRIAVCSVDLDRFRRINENFGHVVGDDLLQQITARFKKTIRKTDTLGRQGGDEFIVVIPDLKDSSDAEVICRKILNALNEPFMVEGKPVAIIANIGISIYPDHGSSPGLLVQHADTALEFAKEKGKATLKLFRPDLGHKVRHLAEIEGALQTALQNKEFYLMYQPIFNADRQVHGFEALLRWQHPALGLIPPDRFISIAEETGLILPIGDWVLREACRQAMAWTSRLLNDTKIFVNISALQLGQADFTHSVGYALKRSGLPPSRLELEVTESYIVPSFKKATQRLQPLQDLGVSIAIDDFGTGHSSFSVLHKLPIDAIKVDRSFVSRIDKDPAGLSTVRAIVNLAHQLGMKTVGEGVETEAQFTLLHEMGCEFYQGYLLAKPLTVDAVEQLFTDSALSVPIKTTVTEKTTSMSDRSGFRRSA